MALTQSSLKTKIKTEISAAITITDNDQLDDVAGAIAKAIVDEIQANAVVTGTVASGPGAGGSVTGTVG